MTDVSIIGLGAMGSALARALLRDGRRVTVWNRTAAKAEPLVRDGAVLALSAADAVGASPVVIVCVVDYAATRGVLETTPETAEALAGRVLVQLTTGSPEEARNLEEWARERGAHYLDGAIMATPSQIARPDTTILVAGRDPTFRKSKPLLEVLGGNLIYTGEPIGSAAALDLAALSYWFSAIFGFAHGARIVESEGLRVDAFGSMVAGLGPVIAEQTRKMGDTIQAGAYAKPEASVLICAMGADLMVRQARDARINAEFPKFAQGLFGKAVAAGYGEEEVAALIKVLRAAA